MEIKTIIFDNEHESSMIIIYEDESKEPASYPPEDPKLKKIVKDFGGTYEISRATYQYNKEVNMVMDRWDRFKEREITVRDSFVIDSIIAADLTKADIMKIKMSMFKAEEVKTCNNKDLLTNLRKENDVVNLLMYYGMIKNGINNWS